MNQTPATGAGRSPGANETPPHGGSLRTTDPMERIIETALVAAGIRYQTDRGGENPARLDFYLPDHDVHIEVKFMHSERVGEQMSRAPNVIVAQGEPAVRLLASAIATLPARRAV